MSNKYRSIMNVDFQYAHRFMDWPREAKHLHGHSGLLTIELEDKVDPVTGFAFPCKEAQKIAWAEVLDNFHHATLFQEGDPLLDAVLATYKKEGIVNDPKYCVPLKKIDHKLAWSYPEYRIVVTKKVSTCENLCELFYELLKDKMPIKKVAFRSSLMNAATKEF
ncbi:MAG: 6-carboxytetrahydropterin synthase [Oscillospiraceae bacterium]|nr:6-carboxytetrahydropterin synthase [Oscillospiraceae bacterium]